MITPNPATSRRSFLATSAAVVSALTFAEPLATPAQAQTPVGQPQPLKRYNVTIRRFNPAQGPTSGEQFVLPVDSPDAEHAISSTLANAVSFTTKSSGGSVLPVAFLCTAIAERP